MNAGQKEKDTITARLKQIKGEINGDSYTEFERLKGAAGFDSATLDFDRGNGRIPLEEPFTVTVTVTQKFGIGSVQVVPVTVKAVATGRSEVYWK